MIFHIVQLFPIIMYHVHNYVLWFSSSTVRMWELDHKEDWAPKIWCFWTVVLKTLESLLDSKAIKQVNPKGINHEYSLEDWYWSWSSKIWPLLWKTRALEKTLMLGKIEGRRRGLQSLRWLDGITDLIVMSFWANSVGWWRIGKPGVLHSMELQRVRHVQSDWATTNCTIYKHVTPRLANCGAFHNSLKPHIYFLF